ncbi:hypothetical protein LINGRAHAP2_LOCUS23760, partial [Linum grandiflorum]
VMADIITLTIHHSGRMQWYHGIPEYEVDSVTALDVQKTKVSYNTLTYLATKELDYDWVDRMWYLIPGLPMWTMVKRLISCIVVYLPPEHVIHDVLTDNIVDGDSIGYDDENVPPAADDNHPGSDGDFEFEEDGSSSSPPVHEEGAKSLSPSTYRGSSDSDHAYGGSSDNEGFKRIKSNPPQDSSRNVWCGKQCGVGVYVSPTTGNTYYMGSTRPAPDK